MSSHPKYGRVFSTFFRNSLVREMSFRGNFIITVLTRAFWFAAQLALFGIIYGKVGRINDWLKWEYFAFMATGMLINAIVETFFMPNCANFSELIRTGNLDFVLLKPIDTQFLVSFEKVNVAMLNQLVLAGGLLGYSLYQLNVEFPGKYHIGLPQIAIYVTLLACGVAFFYSLMIALASTSIWFGRNQGLYDFWFYITVFARYPRSIYGGSGDGWTPGDVLQVAFTYVIPILLVVTIPARVLLGKEFDKDDSDLLYWLTLYAGAGAVMSLFVSRWIFHWSLRMYRSASS
jgi:ABC-2 type transport system permease protein